MAKGRRTTKKRRERKETMARADLLISLVKSGSSGDQEMFRKTVEALVAEERARNHAVLADRLVAQLGTNGNGRLEHKNHNREHLLTNPIHDLLVELTPRRSLEDLVLPQRVKQAVQEVVEEHHHSDILRSYNLKPRHRLLFAGPPGNGKTSLAEALASALMIPLVVPRYDALIGSYLGETASRFRRLFDYVRTRSCVLFFDEFDTVGKERGDVHETGEIKRVVSSLLLQIDDLPAHVVVVTATNHPELLDRAVWRRFQLRLELPPPGRAEIEAYFTAASRRLSFPLGVSPKTLAKELSGLSFSELEDLLSDVARKYVLRLPNANPRAVVMESLMHWRAQLTPRKQPK